MSLLSGHHSAMLFLWTWWTNDGRWFL